MEIIANDQGNRTTPSYVAFTDTERLIGDPAKNQVKIKSAFISDAAPPSPQRKGGKTGFRIVSIIDAHTDPGPQRFLLMYPKGGGGRNA